MNVVFIVDDDASGLSSDLNAIAKAGTTDCQFFPLSSPERMFEELKKRVPDLILVHHTWKGLSITQLLQRLVDAAPTTRVVVFTGRPLKIAELIDCVRFGVADYWAKRDLDPTETFRKLSYYCSSGIWTLESLRRPSGSLMQLLQEAETAAHRIASLQDSNNDLQTQLSASRGADAIGIRNAKFSIIKVTAYVTVLTLAAVVLRVIDLPSNDILSIMVILGLFCLFAEGRLSEALLKVKGMSARFKGPK